MADYDLILRDGIALLVAGLGGLAVGIEREWSAKVQQKEERFAGVRTFLLIGLSGALGELLVRHSAVTAGSILMGGVALLILCAYGFTALRLHVDATTEVAALIVLGAGAFAAAGQLTLASALNALTALVLIEKSRMHSLVYRLQSMELEAATRFAVMALVILPLLPTGPYGPDPGFRPRNLWIIVLIFSGINFAGYIARKTIGAQRGYRVTGMLGGLISSTGVTLNFARESRNESSVKKALAYGVIGACTVLLMRVPLILFVFNRPVAIATLPYMSIPFLVGLFLILFSLRGEEGSAESQSLSNPLQLRSAITLAALFQLGLYLVSFISTRYGTGGTRLSAALIGLADVDALMFTMISIGKDPSRVALAAQSIAIGVISNTLLKLILALSIGKGEFRKIAGFGLILLLLASVAAVILAINT